MFYMELLSVLLMVLRKYALSVVLYIYVLYVLHYVKIYEKSIINLFKYIL